MQPFQNKLGQFRLTRPVWLLFGVIGAMLFALFVTVTTTTELPFLQDKTTIFGWNVAAIICVLVVTIARGDAGLGLVVVGSALLIGKTGMQLDLGGLRTSTLELLIAAATIVTFLRRAFATAPPQWPNLFLDRSFLLFGLLTFPALAIAFAREVPAINVVTEVKGYFLYPCLAYLIVSWTRNKRRWQIAATIALLMALVIAIIATWEWAFNESKAMEMLRAYGTIRMSGTFGAVNQYSFYISTMALMAFAWMVGVKRLFLVPVLATMTSILMLAMVISGSRGCWVGLAAGILVLMFFRPPRMIIWLPVIAIGVGLFLKALPTIQERLLLDPASDESRFSMLSLGVQIFLKYPLFGAGWGASFSEIGGVLEPSSGLPWLHNDYLNLLSQVGLVGLISFILIWGRVIIRSVRHIRTEVLPDLKWPMIGCLAALIALLVEAATDHVFWRPDIAGQVWWLTGMLLAGMEIGKLRNQNETSGGN